MRAFVVFTNEGPLFLGFLKKNFRHCSIIIETNHCWLFIDPTLLNISIFTYGKEFDLLKCFRDMGHIVFEAKIKTMKTPTISLLSCVAVVKRIIGIECFYILTPYQLFRYLRSNCHGKISP